MNRSIARIWTFFVCAALAAGTAGAGSFEDAVRARWRGAWVVVGTDVYSSCDGPTSYHTNKLAGTLVTNRGGHRFVNGEIGKVQRLQLKRKRVDLMVSLEVPLLVSHSDGPFTLYNEHACAVSLEIQLPREMTKSKDVEGIDRLIAEVIERFDTRERALDSGSWNEREMASYPEDYALTLARHAAWRAEQHNLVVSERKDVAMQQVKERGRAIDDDPHYLQGLAAGVDAMNRLGTDDCELLVSRSYESNRKPVPEERRFDDPISEQWRKGYDDGQRLVYSIILLERLDRCYVPVPPVPGETEPMTTEVSHHDSSGAEVD